jgi:hypothetical protein
MAYAIALIPFPRMPNETVKVTNPDGTMVKEWITFFTELRRWGEKHGLALDQLEP